MARHKKYYKGGKWWFPPSLGRGEFCESMFICGSSMHRRCSSYALTNFLFGLCKFVWIIELLVNLLSPHPGAPTRPFTPKVLRTREHTLISFSFVVFAFGFVIESIKELRGASKAFHIEEWWIVQNGPRQLSVMMFDNYKRINDDERIAWKTISRAFCNWNNIKENIGC